MSSVFGEDHRKDPFEISDPGWEQILPAMGMMITDSDVKMYGPYLGGQTLYGIALRETLGIDYNKPMCEGEKFAVQAVLGFCSSFLVTQNSRTLSLFLAF